MTQQQAHSGELEDDRAGRRPLASAVPVATVVPGATVVPVATVVPGATVVPPVTAVARMSWAWPGASRRTPAGLRGRPVPVGRDGA
jgi:hypothetical protein